MVRFAASALLLVLLVAPTSARAWANAQVGSARGTVRVEDDGRLRVALELDVHVMGGWLTELEVAGLDRPLVVDESTPAAFVRRDGEPVPFQVVADDGGRVVFRFPNGRSPRVGDYVASFAYTSALTAEAISAIADDRVRYAWTFPAWAAGLDSVELTLDAPSGAAVAVAAEDGFEENARVERVADRTRLVFHRTYLPRGVAWSIGFSLPRDAVPVSLRPPARATPRVAAVATSRDGRPQPSIPLVAGLFTVVAVVKRLAFARAARRADATERPLVPVPAWLAVFVQGALGVVAAYAWRSIPEAAFVALVLVVVFAAQRTARRRGTARLGGFRPATLADRRRARWDRFVSAVSPVAWFDASRVVGLVVYVALGAAVLRFHLLEPADSVDAIFSVPHALALLFVLFLVGGSSMIPMRVSARLVVLEDAARTLRFPEGVADALGMRLAIHRDTNDVPQDARLRLTSEHRAPGLVRLDVAVLERATLGGYVASPAVLVVVRQGSEAERILVRVAGASSIRTAPGGRRARVLPITRATFALLDRLVEAGPSDAPAPARAARTALVSAASAHA